MSPRAGRPITENPKADRITVRLTEFQQDALIECAEKFGTTKANVVCRGLRLMEVAKNSSESRQLFDAIDILDELVRKKSMLVDKQRKQVESNFKWYIDSIKDGSYQKAIANEEEE